MSPHALRLTLIALVVGAAAAVLPTSALAGVTPVLTVDQSAGTTAGSTTSLGLDLAFAPSLGDSLKDLSITLPPGLLIDESIDTGACLVAPGPLPACQIASGTATLAGVVTPAALYLERPPSPNDLAGVQLVAGAASVAGSLSMHSSLDVGIRPSFDTVTHLSFGGLATLGMSALNLKLSQVRLPSSCAADPNQMVAAWTDSTLDGAPVVRRQPLTITGCNTLAFTPQVISAVTLTRGTWLASVVTTVLQPAGQSASERMVLALPPGIIPSTKLASCIEGVPCVIGTASMTSPVLPASSLTNGTLTLSGTQMAPTLTLAFPEPTPIVLSASVSRANGTINFTGLPDIPLTAFTLNLTGTSVTGPVLVAHLANCHNNQFHSTLFPRSGAQAVGLQAVALYKGCPAPKHRGIARPTASASLTGVAAGRPRLSVSARRGSRAPLIRSLRISLPAGLSFDAAVVDRRASSPGAGLKSMRLVDGRLFAVFTHPVARGAVKLAAPLLVESSSLRRRVKAGTVSRLKVIIGMTDTIGDRPRVGLFVTPR